VNKIRKIKTTNQDNSHDIIFYKILTLKKIRKLRKKTLDLNKTLNLTGIFGDYFRNLI